MLPPLQGNSRFAVDGGLEQRYWIKNSTACFDDSITKQRGTLTRQEVAKERLIVFCARCASFALDEQ